MILLVGSITCIAGVVLILRHLHLWRQQINATGEPRTHVWLNRQLRRRTLTSTCIAVLGFIIILLHFRAFWENRPTGPVILISCALTLVFMIFVLASLDFLATSTMLRTQRRDASQAAEKLTRDYRRLNKKRTDSHEGTSAETKGDGT